MTGLAFAAVPLYQAFCRATGYGGATQSAAAAPARVLGSHASRCASTPTSPPICRWSSRPSSARRRCASAKPGSRFTASAICPTEPIVARATYNVTPHMAGAVFRQARMLLLQGPRAGAGGGGRTAGGLFRRPRICRPIPTHGDIGDADFVLHIFPRRRISPRAGTCELQRGNDMAHGEVKHDYHLVNPSPWPFVGSVGALFLTARRRGLMQGARRRRKTSSSARAMAAVLDRRGRS